MTAWPTIIPVSGTVQRDPMVSALTLYDGLLGEAGAAPVLASAATVDIAGGAAATAGLVEISGTATITSFGTSAAAGARRLLRFQAGATVNHSAALALPAAANVTVEPGALMLAERVAAGWRVLDLRLPSLMTPGSIDVTGAIRSYLTNNRVLVQEQRDDATHAGGATAGSWQPRGLVLVKTHDPGNHATVGGATLTLAAGTYDIRTRSPFFFTGGTRTRLWNITASAVVPNSVSDTINAGATTIYITHVHAEARCVATFASPVDLRLEYFCQASRGTDGLGGHDAIAAGVEIYATIDALKIG